MWIEMSKVQELWVRRGFISFKLSDPLSVILGDMSIN
jgi:hypothetical protein